MSQIDREDISVFEMLNLAKKIISNFFLKEVTDMVSETISDRLKRAFNVTVIPEIWENSGNHYLGLGATVIYNNFEKETLIHGMKEVL